MGGDTRSMAAAGKYIEIVNQEKDILLFYSSTTFLSPGTANYTLWDLRSWSPQEGLKS